MTEPPADLDTAEPLRVLVLSKRRYMGRDLLDDRYGRFRELPAALSRRGARVQGLCLNYRSGSESRVVDDADGAHVAWRSLNLRRLPGSGPGSYRGALDRIGEEFGPDVVWACSDTPHAVLGALAARRLGARLVIDLYDNFEAYPLHRVPGMTLLLRRVLRRAQAVTCVSEPLREKLRDDYGLDVPIEVIGNAVPEGVFVPQEKSRCRRKLGLPDDAILIGTAGAISATRGLGTLLDAFRKLRATRPGLHLVLAGPADGSVQLPASDSHVHLLGSLPPAEVPTVLGALDVSVICNVDSAFGRYCFPQKFYESLGCGVPVAVADVGAMKSLLAGHPDCRFAPGDAASLAARVEKLIERPVVPDLAVPSWASESERLLRTLRQAVRKDA